MEEMFRQKHNLFFHVNPSNGIWSLEKRTCHSRYTLVWTWIFLPVMPVDLEHLHLTGMSRFQDVIGCINAVYSIYLPGSYRILLSEVSVNIYRKAQKGIRNIHLFSHLWTPFCSTMNDPCNLRINLKPGGHKDLITIRSVCFQERNHFILVCKINLDEFIIGSWVCKAFDIVVVLLEGLEYCRA